MSLGVAIQHSPYRYHATNNWTRNWAEAEAELASLMQQGREELYLALLSFTLPVSDTERSGISKIFLNSLRQKRTMVKSM